ncbi:MAG: hypothetical protein AB7F43_12375 [Bacteriovoracia bacterium]
MRTRKIKKGLNVEIRIQFNGGSSKITFIRVLKWIIPLAVLAVKIIVHRKWLVA